MKILLSFFIIVFSLTGCLTMDANKDTNNDALPEGLILCDKNRSQRCTREYMPVCGYIAETKDWKTYPNKCEACRDPNVAGYISGSCGGEGKRK